MSSLLALPGTEASAATGACPAKGRIASGYGWRTHPATGGKVFHYGVDIANTTGTRINAGFSGTVTYAGESGNLGRHVIINSSGVITIYGHMNSLSVKKNQKVRKGRKIGTMGSTGMSSGPHLHLAVKEFSPSPSGGDYVNPTSYFKLPC
ncbi:M23 family metallopeptidase [Streptomyces sp. NPDC015345]|uniref:M23 family metallopeptidase n=1 Tax=Streptomyces sp. NPDC015345 TaxID=3364953 RepID=UPI0036F7B688